MFTAPHQIAPPTHPSIPSGEEHCKNAVDEGLTLSVRFEGALVLAEQENRSAASLSEEVLAHVLAASIFEFNG
jgi:hypothetical protein